MGQGKGTVMGWIVSPQKRYVEVLTPVPQNVTLPGNRINTDIIRMKLCWSTVGSLSNMTDVLIKTCEDTETQREYMPWQRQRLELCK